MKLEASPFQTSVVDAFRKLKSHVYHDTSDLLLRDQLAAFETVNREHLEKILWKLSTAIESYDRKPFFIDECFENIGCRILPKKFVPESDKLPDNFVTNKRTELTYQLAAATFFINVPIELHIVSVLWLMQYGYRLDKALGPECLGNRLLLNKDQTGIAGGLGLFKRYFVQYQKWRDDAVEEALSRLKSHEDVVVINLDVMDYFHSVRVDFDEIEKCLNIDPQDNLHLIFKRIHSSYTDLLVSRGALPGMSSRSSNEPVILPIGLASSYLLANWHLRELDKRILKRIPQTYYGRYVDDILIVIPKPSFEYHETEKCDDLRFDFARYKRGQERKANRIDFENLSTELRGICSKRSAQYWS